MSVERVFIWKCSYCMVEVNKTTYGFPEEIVSGTKFKWEYIEGKIPTHKCIDCQLKRCNTKES